MSYPSTSEIATLAEVKGINNITASTFDTWLTANIPIVCRSVEDYCRRRFVKNNWTQWTSMDREIMTDNFPINNVLIIGTPYDLIKIDDTNNIYNFAVMQTTSNNISVDGKFVATNTSTLVSTEYLFSTYTTVGALKTAVEAALAGVTFTYQNNPTPVTFSTMSTLCIRPTFGKTLTVGVNYFDQSTNTSLGDIYRIGDNSDRIVFSPNFMTSNKALYSGNYIGPYTTGYTNIDSSGYSFETYNNTDMLIMYNSGYDTSNMPSTLKWVVAAILQDLMSLYDMQSSGVYKGIYRQESLGDYQYTLATESSIAGILNRYHDQLDLYKKKII